MRVVVAMSGGVDSSVAAALLCRQGHEVIGVTMQIWPDQGVAREERRGGCCAMGAVRDARAVAAHLGIAYYVFQMREAFERHVISAFADAYAAGRTPNPCIACNAHIKFDALLDKARRIGADALATGHYARILPDAGGGWSLLRATDRRKDQSYVLYPLRRADLGFCRFPLGDIDKARTRALAAEMGLAVADKPDSQEICFVEPGGYADVVAARHPEAVRPGPIVDVRGTVLGSHRGIAHYTVGQRRGLGLQASTPRYVVAVNAAANTVVVGGPEDGRAVGCGLSGVNWLAPVPRAGATLRVKVRSGPVEHTAQVWPADGGARLRFEVPVRAVTPGQAAVMYDGDRVVGGGEIAEVLNEEPLRAAVGLGSEGRQVG